MKLLNAMWHYKKPEWLSVWLAEDKLFNNKASRCLDVAGRRHTPNTPLRLAECYGGANQSFLVGGVE